MINLHKDYQKAFLLEPTKLRRLVDTIHQSLADQQNLTQHDAYEVFLIGNRREEMTSLEQVLALDNSRKRRITRLVLTCSASSSSTPGPEREVQVDFGRSQTTGSGGATKVVAITIRSQTAAWAARALSEVEEQVERNWAEHVRPVVVLCGLLIVATLLVVSPFISLRPLLSYDWWLTAPDIERIEAMLAEHRPLTDDELREVSTMQLQNFVGAWRARDRPFAGQTRWTLLISVPMFVVVVCVTILITTCYPTTVFLWGDELQRYERTLQRRRIMWGIVGTVTVVGISSRLLSEGISSWVPR